MIAYQTKLAAAMDSAEKAVEEGRAVKVEVEVKTDRVTMPS